MKKQQVCNIYLLVYI